MTLPEANEHSDQNNESNSSPLIEEGNSGNGKRSGADELEKLEPDQLETMPQSGEPLIVRPDSNKGWQIDHTRLDVLLVASPGFADCDYY